MYEDAHLESAYEDRLQADTDNDEYDWEDEENEE